MAYLHFTNRRLGVCLRYLHSVNLLRKPKSTSVFQNTYACRLRFNASDFSLLKPLNVCKVGTQGCFKQLNSKQNDHLKPSQFRTSEFYKNMAEVRKSCPLSSFDITKNVTLYTKEAIKNEINDQTLELKTERRNPLVLLMSWLMAKPKHLKKYINFYTEMGFDVVVVHISPWQLLWPTKGSHVVAAETIKFLDNNKSFEPIVVHGFSVGAYQFGEMMLQMARYMDRYTHILNRISCQIWDSAADVTEIAVGFPKAIFPKNLHMQNVLRNYTLYHLKTFHNQATVHYIRSSQMFHSTIVKKPALFLVSENDPIGPPSSNKAVSNNWERANIDITFYTWKHSSHAAHFIKHNEDYVELVLKHLEKSGVLESTEIKRQAKL